MKNSDKYSENWSVRDEFAAKAMQGMISKYIIKDPDGPKIVCELSFIIADAMLKEREKEGS